MDKVWKSMCKGLWFCCGKAVEKHVESWRFYKMALFCCEKPSIVAEKLMGCVGKDTLFSGKTYKRGKGKEVAVSTIST